MQKSNKYTNCDPGYHLRDRYFIRKLNIGLLHNHYTVNSRSFPLGLIRGCQINWSKYTKNGNKQASVNYSRLHSKTQQENVRIKMYEAVKYAISMRRNYFWRPSVNKNTVLWLSALLWSITRPIKGHPFPTLNSCRYLSYRFT